MSQGFQIYTHPRRNWSYIFQARDQTRPVQEGQGQSMSMGKTRQKTETRSPSGDWGKNGT